MVGRPQPAHVLTGDEDRPPNLPLVNHPTELNQSGKLAHRELHVQGDSRPLARGDHRIAVLHRPGHGLLDEDRHPFSGRRLDHGPVKGWVRAHRDGIEPFVLEHLDPVVVWSSTVMPAEFLEGDGKPGGVRLALGASRKRLITQAIAEATPVLLLGGALGVVAAEGAVRVFVAAAPAGLPRVESIALSAPVVAFSLTSTDPLAGSRQSRQTPAVGGQPWGQRPFTVRYARTVGGGGCRTASSIASLRPSSS